LPPVHITRDIDAPLTDKDRSLLYALGALTWPGGDKLAGNLNAMVDPFTGYGFVTLMFPRSIKPAQWTNTAITMSYRIAVGAMKHDSSLRSLTVRIITPIEAGDEEVVMTLFRGNTNRDAIEQYLDNEAQPNLREIWEKVFATTWWNPSASDPARSREKAPDASCSRDGRKQAGALVLSERRRMLESFAVHCEQGCQGGLCRQPGVLHVHTLWHICLGMVVAVRVGY
jgi:hypothetical protein